jgi:hypothetical protein
VRDARLPEAMEEGIRLVRARLLRRAPDDHRRHLIDPHGGVEELHAGRHTKNFLTGW